MKKISFNCTECGWEVTYNKNLQNSPTFTCSNCNTEYDETIFTSSRTRNPRRYFKKYGIPKNDPEVNIRTFYNREIPLGVLIEHYKMFSLTAEDRQSTIQD